jgi:hypothetical protein
VSHSRCCYNPFKPDASPISYVTCLGYLTETIRYLIGQMSSHLRCCYTCENVVSASPAMENLPPDCNPDLLQRISLMDTSSFDELPPHWQNHLRWLHDDYYYHRHNQLWSAQVWGSLQRLIPAYHAQLWARNQGGTCSILGDVNLACLIDTIN